MNEDKKPKKEHFFVDAKKYETEKTYLTGAEIKTIATVPAGYQLFLEAQGNDPDRAISDSESIEIGRKTKHFYAVPPATFGA